MMMDDDHDYDDDDDDDDDDDGDDDDDVWSWSIIISHEENTFLIYSEIFFFSCQEVFQKQYIARSSQQH